MEAGSDKRESGRGSKRFQAKGKYGARGPSEMRHVSDERPLKFEISPSDFPELGHEATSSPREPLTYHKSPTVSPHATTSSSVSKFKAAIKEPVKKQCDVKEPDPEVPEEEGQRLTSWAKVASLPPKKTCLVATSTTALESTNQTSEGTKAVLNKRKKRKKKKTPQLKTADNGLDEEMFVPAEPPKIEDEKEFPGLVLSPVSQMKQSQVQGNRSKEVMEYRLASTDPTAQPSGEKINRKQPVPIKPKGQEELKGEKSTGRKSKVPIQLDLGNMLAALALKQQSNKGNTEQKPVSLTVGGAMPVAHKESHPKKPSWVQDKIAHNPLDSTSPLVKKGKQREVPKAKKPTPLKRVILKEREERKQKRLLEEQGISTLPLEPQSACSEAEEHLSDQNDDSAGDLGSLIMDVAEDSLQERPAVENSIPPPPKLHSRKFRDYCNQVLSKEVDECVTSLLKELVRFQDRLYQKDPRKARMKRRLVLGMREVLKHLRLHKVKCVVISPNCERSQSKGGLDEALHTIIATCREQDIPFVFALSRKALGRCISKAVPVSVVGIFNYDGAQDLYHQMIELSSEARKTYEVMVKNLEESSQEDQSELIEAAFLDEYAVRELETLSVRDPAQVL